MKLSDCKTLDVMLSVASINDLYGIEYYNDDIPEVIVRHPDKLVYDFKCDMFLSILDDEVVSAFSKDKLYTSPKEAFIQAAEDMKNYGYEIFEDEKWGVSWSSELERIVKETEDNDGYLEEVMKKIRKL